MEDLEGHQESPSFVKSKRLKYHLAVSIVLLFPLFSIIYLFAALGLMDNGQTMGTFLLLTMIAKALFAVIIIDIYARALKEAQMKLTIERNESFSKLLFHEIKTPLHSLAVSVELLEQGDNLKPSGVELFSSIKASSSLLNDSLLSLQQIEDGSFGCLNLSRFNISDSIHNVILVFLGPVKQKGIHIELKISDSLPESVVGDRRLWELVLSSLLSNAIKFSYESENESSNGGRICLDVSSSEKDSLDLVTVAVSDNGPGIPRDGLGQLFGQTAGASGWAGMGMGITGLRLGLCKQVVTLMGGSVWLESDVGQGSTFCVCIPFKSVRPLGITPTTTATTITTESGQTVIEFKKASGEVQVDEVDLFEKLAQGSQGGSLRAQPKAVGGKYSPISVEQTESETTLG